MKNNELNMETLKQVNGGATQEYVEPAVIDDPKELEAELKRKLEEQRKEFETLSQELMNKVSGGAADDLSEVKKLDRSELEELVRRKFEDAV